MNLRDFIVDQRQSLTGQKETKRVLSDQSGECMNQMVLFCGINPLLASPIGQKADRIYFSQAKIEQKRSNNTCMRI